MNGHDSTREQNMEARIRLAAARRELADAVNDATTGIGCLTCDDPQTMNHIRACWKRIYDRYLETDSLIADLAACARNITDGGEWKPSELATESKPIDIAEGCACFTAETPDRVLIIPSEPTPGENTAKRLANTLNALTGDVLLDATGIRLLGTRFLFAYHSRLDRPVDHGVNLAGMRFPDRLGLLDRAERYPGFLPLRPVVANGTGALERSGRLRAGLDALESLAVRDAVLNAHLSKTEIASALGITRQALYNRHKELFGELKEQCRRKSRHPIDSTAYRIRDGRTIPAKEKE